MRYFSEYPDPVNDLAFHPNGRVLTSGGDDAVIRMYDIQRIGARRPFRYINVLYLWLDIYIIVFV